VKLQGSKLCLDVIESNKSSVPVFSKCHSAGGSQTWVWLDDDVSNDDDDENMMTTMMMMMMMMMMMTVIIIMMLVMIIIIMMMMRVRGRGC
jgi:hypothetical protein